MALRIGVVGLGIMGGAFAANLVKGGLQVTGYDPVKSKMNALVKAGGKAGKSPADVARKSDVVLTSLTSPTILDAVVSGKDGILAGARKGLIVMETSTLAIKDKESARAALGNPNAARAVSGNQTTRTTTKKKKKNARPTDEERGKELYERHCLACHGEKGHGDGPMGESMVVDVPSLVGVLKVENIVLVVLLF